MSGAVGLEAIGRVDQDRGHRRRPRRSKSSRCGFAIVGVVSPEPIMARRRAGRLTSVNPAYVVLAASLVTRPRRAGALGPDGDDDPALRDHVALVPVPVGMLTGHLMVIEAQ